MKKLILSFSVLALMVGTLSISSANAACFEAYYPTATCETAGWENCVNQTCPPPPECDATDSCEPEVGG
jgi:hypothetical protein